MKQTNSLNDFEMEVNPMTTIFEYVFTTLRVYILQLENGSSFFHIHLMDGNSLQILISNEKKLVNHGVRSKVSFFNKNSH